MGISRDRPSLSCPQGKEMPFSPASAELQAFLKCRFTFSLHLPTDKYIYINFIYNLCMYKKIEIALAVIGVMISLSLCNCVYAQEVQSPCKEGCVNKTFTFSSDKLKETLAQNDNNDNLRYGASLILKSDQGELRHFEKDLTNFIITLMASCTTQNNDPSVQQGDNWSYLIWRLKGPCQVGIESWFDIGLNTESNLNYSKKNLTNVCLSLYIYQYQPKDKCHCITDRHRQSEDESSMPMAYVT
jgi:hypothetical protein